MKPHPHIRKTIKWGGAALTVLLVVVWIGSGWYWFLWMPKTLPWWTVHEGRVMAGWIIYPWYVVVRDGLSIGRGEFMFQGGIYYRSISQNGAWAVAIPLWPLVLVSLVLTSLAFRLDTLARRRDRMNLCPNCHYDRAGLAPNSPCPECGQPTP